MKIAIIHDELVRRGGAEQVTFIMHQAFPDAPIFTSCYNPRLTYEGFKECNIITSWMSRFVKSEKMLKALFFPFGIWAMRGLKVKGYDVVLMSTTNSAKYVTIEPGTTVIAFCHFPFRLAWFPESYKRYRSSKGLYRVVFNWVISRLKKIDTKAAGKIDWFITNTPHIAALLDDCYCPSNPVEVMPTSIVLQHFNRAECPREDYYLVVSRLESHKMVDLSVRAFNNMPSRKLIVVGKGSEKDKLRKMAASNIQFLEGLSMQEIAELYANCKALIFPQVEDYGLVPIEANASGRPVLAYGKGGVTYTMIPYEGDATTSTAIFFNSQTPEAIVETVEKFETLSFDPIFIRNHAERFSETAFIDNLRRFVEEKQQL